VRGGPMYTTLPDRAELLRLTSNSYGELFTSNTTTYKQIGQDRTCLEPIWMVGIDRARAARC
jgi:hypothetical protein